MARDIAHGEVRISLDIERLEGELRAAEGQVARTLNSIGRMKGEAEIGVKTRELYRDLAEAKAALKTLQAEKLEASVDLDTTELDAKIKRLQAQIKRLEARDIKIKADAKELDDVRRTQEKLNREREKGRLAEAKYRADINKRFEDEMKHEAEMHMLARKRFDDEMMREGRLQMEARKRVEQEQTQMRRMAGEQQRAIDLDRNRAVELEKLRLQYIKLHDEIEKSSRAKLFDFFGDETARRRYAQTAAELSKVGARLKELGDTDDDLRRFARANDDAGSGVRRLLASLGSVRLHLGFFSASLKQAAVGFMALGPVIFGLVGQIASLVGVLGTGLTGALAVAGAGAAGFALSALGIGLIMKPLIGDLQDAMKASEAYGDAVRKYGKDSTQAQTAQEKLNQTLGDVGPETRKAFQSLSGMSDRWGRLTSGARPMFFETLTKGIQAANRLMPMFARQSVSAFNTAGQEAQRWLDMISGPEAAAGIKELMSNFTDSFPALNAGFRSIFAGLSRVAVSASKLLPSLTEGFSKWASNLEESIGTGVGLDQKIARLVDHMRQVGQFAQSAGRMLAAFFNAGANEGATLLSTLTSIFDRWTSWMNSAAGQRGLADFFSQANAIGSQFIGTLSKIGIAIFEFSQAFAPLSAGAIAAVNAFSSLTAAIMGLAPARAVVTMLGGALAGAFIATKIHAAVAGIVALGRAIASLGAAGALTSVASLLNPIMAIGTAIGVAAAAFYLLETDAAKAASGLDTLSSSISRTTSMISALSSADTEQAAAKLALLSAQQQYQAAVENTKTALKENGRTSREYKEALLQERQALSYVQQAHVRVGETATKAAKDRRAAQAAAKRDNENALQLVKDIREAGEDDGALNQISEGLTGILQKNPGKLVQGFKDLKQMFEDGASNAELLAHAQQLVAASERNIETAANGAARGRLNAMRASLKGANAQNAILKDVGGAWARLEKTLPKSGQKAIALMDPREATQAIKLADTLTRAGHGGLVNRLLNPRDLQGSLAGLRQLDRWVRGIGEKPIKPKIEPDAKPARRTIDSVRKDAEGKPIKPKVDPDTKPAERKIIKLRKSTTKVDLTADVKTERANRQLDSIDRRGRGREVRINTKADTKNAERDINKVTNKKGKQATVQVRAEGVAQVTSQINRIASRKLPPKRVQITAPGAGAATSAINKVAGIKIQPKKVRFDVDDNEAVAANRRVQAFQDKKIRITTPSDLSGATAASAAISSLPSSKTIPITFVFNTVGSPPSAARAAGGPAIPFPAFASGGPIQRAKTAPAETRRNMNTAAQANVRQKRPGLYKRPTLLVGEERQDEYVIATNPAYRSANTAYLAAAANRFGYQLTPTEAAAKGKPPKPSKVGRGAQKYIADDQHRYTFLRGKISKYTSKSSDEQALQDLLIRAGKQSGYRYNPIINPLKVAQKTYTTLTNHMEGMIRRRQKSVAHSRNVDLSINKKTLSADKKAVQKARLQERKVRRQEPRKGSKRAWRKRMNEREQATKRAEQRLERNKQRDRDAKANVKNKQQAIGDLWRELTQQIPSEKAGLARQIRELMMKRSGVLDDDSLGGSDSTPIGIQLGQLDTARYDTWQSFAGNLLGAGVQGGLPGGPLGPAGGGVGMSGALPGGGFTASGPSFYSTAGGGANVLVGGGASPAGSGPATQSAGGGGTVVNQNIKIEKPPPDPHSFSKQLGWEAAAMLG